MLPYIIEHQRTGKMHFYRILEPLPEANPELLPSRYIERFRHGAPQSREKRQHLDDAFEEKQHPFWWMADSNLPHSSTPSKERNTGIHDFVFAVFFFMWHVTK